MISHLVSANVSVPGDVKGFFKFVTFVVKI